MMKPSPSQSGWARWALVLVLFAGGLLAVDAGLFGPKGDTVEAKQRTIREQRDAVLAEACAAQPALKERVKQAAGYATFRQTDVNLFLLASGNGYGVLVDNRSGKETFLRMASIGGGVGMGVKDLARFGDRRVALIREFASLRQAGALDSATWESLTRKWLANAQERLDLWKRYQKRISRSVSPMRAAQFLQVEHQIALFTDLAIASEMPVLGSNPR